MPDKRNTTIIWDQVVTKCHFQVGKMKSDILAKGIAPESINWPERAKNWFFAQGGRLDLETEKLVYGPKLQRAATPKSSKKICLCSKHFCY
jgi:hypothetical protein